jgi:hypothetical protein
MKFTKPINREVEIRGNTFVVSMDEAGIGFRLKGKRKTAHVNWANVLDITEGEEKDSTGTKGFHDTGAHSRHPGGQQFEPADSASSNVSHTAAAGEGPSEA